MADVASYANGVGRRVRFDPTINLGHVLTAVAFLFSTVAAWYTLNAQVATIAREIERKADKDAFGRAEVELTRRIVEVRQHTDATVARTADDIRDMKLMMREGFRDLDARLERKADKPGQR